jgi:hypothetical protein
MWMGHTDLESTMRASTSGVSGPTGLPSGTQVGPYKILTASGVEDADPDIPVLFRAKAECAKLQ